jgi:hypothetical protein
MHRACRCSALWNGIHGNEIKDVNFVTSNVAETITYHDAKNIVNHQNRICHKATKTF